MKSNFKLLFSFLSMACILFALTSCGGQQNQEGHDHSKEEKHEGHNHESHDGHNHDAHEGHNHGSHDGHDHGSHDGHNHGADVSKVDMTTAEYASAYVCPMHCKGSGSDKAGTCPVCKMKYVANAEHQEDGHKH